jgi:hypothetical protein
MGHVGGEVGGSEQGIEQARFAHAHPAEHGHPQASIG